MRILCQHCRCADDRGFDGTFKSIVICRRCGKWTWVRAENSQVKSSGKAYSWCPGKCKIGKLEPEIREKIDEMLIQGVTYQDIIELCPAAGDLNGANLSTHNNKHLHPDFRVSRSVATEEHWLAKMNAEKE
jgi:hypothetical protein